MAPKSSDIISAFPRDAGKENQMGDCALQQERTSFGDLVEHYLYEHPVRPATAESYRKAASRWCAETAIEFIDAITRDDVLTWRNAVLGRARPETWNKYRRHLRALMNYAVERGWVAENPFCQVPPARTGVRLKKTVDVQLVQNALRVLAQPSSPLRPGWFWAIVVRAFFYSGVRLRQLVELEWRDVDLAAGVWRIRAETSKTRREWQVPLVGEVISDLRLLYERTREQTGRYPQPRDQVYNATLFYPRYKGTRIEEAQVRGFFQRLSVILGQKMTPHRLRHTMATLLAAQGDIRTLQELLGHADISTTMGYIHPDLERMRGLVGHLPGLSLPAGCGNDVGAKVSSVR